MHAVVTSWVYVTQQVTRDRGYNNQLASRLHGLVALAAYRVGGWVHWFRCDHRELLAGLNFMQETVTVVELPACSGRAGAPKRLYLE